MLLALGIVCVIQLALTLSHPSEIEAPNSYIRNTLDRLLMDVDEFFNWIVGNSQFYGKFKVSEPQLLMMMQLRKSLRNISAVGSPDWLGDLEEVWLNGHQCSTTQKQQQENDLKPKTITHLCGDETWYKLIHLTYPHGKYFLDVGANRGFIGALLLTLWGGNEFHSSPKEVFAAINKKGYFQGNRNPYGQCRTGKDQGIALKCSIACDGSLTSSGQQALRDSSGVCISSAHCKHVRVVSFEASRYIAESMRTVIQHIDAENGQIQSEQAIVIPEVASSGHRNVHRPKLSSAASLSNMWRYENYALSDRDIGGIVQFPSQNSSFRAGFEGGSVAAFGQRKRFREDIHQQQHVIANSIGFEAVSITSIDSFLDKERSRGYGRCEVSAVGGTGARDMSRDGSGQSSTSVPAVDILKIDAEGHDLHILRGARRLIHGWDGSGGSGINGDSGSGSGSGHDSRGQDGTGNGIAGSTPTKGCRGGVAVFVLEVNKRQPFMEVLREVLASNRHHTSPPRTAGAGSHHSHASSNSSDKEGGAAGVNKVYSRHSKEDEYLGYSCFAPSRHGLFKITGGCADTFIPRPQPSNIFCISRHYAPLTAFAFELISFPLMLNRYGCGTSDSSCITAFMNDVVKSTWCKPLPSCLNAY